MRAFPREEARRAVALRAEPCHSLTAGVRPVADSTMTLYCRPS